MSDGISRFDCSCGAAFSAFGPAASEMLATVSKGHADHSGDRRTTTMTDADKTRFLAEIAGWVYEDSTGLWRHPAHGWEFRPEWLSYGHSLDAIARDLLPLLREKGWGYSLAWLNDASLHRFLVWAADGTTLGYTPDPEPARAAFEAIFEALGGEE